MRYLKKMFCFIKADMPVFGSCVIELQLPTKPLPLFLKTPTSGVPPQANVNEWFICFC